MSVDCRWSGLALVGFIVVAGVVGGPVALRYQHDMQAIRDRLTAGSQIVQTRHGPVEYTTWGDGPPVLVLHGAGGGYDLGLLQARAFGGDGFRWISPSRFGYLRTPMPADASTVAQADAYAELLDALGIERVAILAMSGGVPSALQFGLRYPQRTAALVLLSSAPYTPLGASEQPLPVPIWVYQALFSSDFPYWLLQRVARPRLEALFDVTPARRAALPLEEQAMVTSMVDGFQPVTGRIDGLRNEGAAIDPRMRYPVEAMRAPTLVVHAIDDGINPFPIGEYTAQHIPGGHLLLGHQVAVRAQVSAFLRQHAALAA